MNLSIPFRVYEGKALLEVDEERTRPIVQDFLFEHDYVLLVAKEKMGKSLLGLQLACNLSSGTPFLDALEIHQPNKVWYIAAEGKDNDIKDRLIRMSKKIPINVDNFKLICIAGFRLNTREGIEGMNQLIDVNKDRLPRVIIIDPLYMAIKGSIKDDFVVNDFTYTVRRFAEVCDAAVIVIHHSRRPIRLANGTIINDGDDEIFGSAFLKASVDHIFYMGRVSNTDRIFLKCDTQRSGAIIETMELKLHEPEPLYFEEVEHREGLSEQIAKVLLEHPQGLSIKQLTKLVGVSKVSIYVNLKYIDRLKKTNTRPVIYYLK